MYSLRLNADITPLTTFRVDARCAALVEWETVADLIDAIGKETLPRPWLSVGGGSNLLFTKPFEGTVFHRLGQPVLDDVCADYCRRGVWGFENLSGIPGTVYGAAVQNAGAYGTEMRDVIESVQVLDLTTLTPRVLSNAEMRFGYRDSIFKDAAVAARLVITGVSLAPRASGPSLSHKAVARAVEEAGGAGAVTPAEVRRAVLAMRAAKLPDVAETGSAGSFFRNPELTAAQYEAFAARWPEAPHFAQPDGRVKVPAAWLIDHAGLKGARCGGAMVWPDQPLVIVNATGHASAADVVGLERRVQRAVAAKFNVNLIPEVQHI